MISAGIISDLRYPRRKFRPKPETAQIFIRFQIDILNNILSVLCKGDHFKNDLCHQPLRIFDDSSKGIGVATQYFFNQVLICKRISFIGHLIG